MSVSRPRVDRRARVAALVCHYRCEAWLADCLASLVEQTRPLEAIIVIDDASPEPPVAIAREFPSVTLLAAAEHSGPYRLIQSVIDGSDYDAYLIQDADDWSAPERLSELLTVAETEAAELVGSQEVRILCDEGEVMPVAYPLDVNAALHEHPASFSLLHGTSLIGRDLIVRLGGFASGLRIGGDVEFLWRAAHATRVVNSPRYLYYRRKRAGALTTDPRTGFRSTTRVELQKRLVDRARENALRFAGGEPPDLVPVCTAQPVALEQVAGPPARRVGVPSAPVIVRRRDVSRQRAAAPRPVFVIGAPRSGENLLSWALAQHPALGMVVEPRWIGDLIMGAWRALATARSGTPWRSPAGGDDPAFYARLGATIDGFVREAVAMTSGAGPVARWIDSTPDNVLRVYGLWRLFPEARFLHVVRDPAEAVATLMASPAHDGRFQSQDAAVSRWMQCALAGLMAERALGPETVLRVEHANFVRDPQGTLRRCLAFLGEAFDHRCLRPVREACGAPPAAIDNPLLASEEARSLVAELLAVPVARSAPDPLSLEALREAFLTRCREGFEDRAEWPLVHRLRDVVLNVVPEGASLAVVTRGDDELLAIGGRRAWHFPRLPDGTYAGYHPADSDEAVAHLEKLREEGVEYLVIPATSIWWLQYYGGLREHLERCSRMVAWQEGTGAVFALGVPSSSADPGWLAAVVGIETAEAPRRVT